MFKGNFKIPVLGLDIWRKGKDKGERYVSPNIIIIVKGGTKENRM